MQYSPKLKRVMAELKAILKQNDIAGFIVLAEPGFGEHGYVLDPSFSCAKIEGDKVSVSTKNVDPKKKTKIAANTSNMFMILSTLMMEQGYALAQLSQVVDKKLKAEHRPGTSHSQTELDN
jgi:hypothetical protein